MATVASDVFPRVPRLNSADTAWAGVPFEVRQVPDPDDELGSFARRDECGLLVLLDGHVEFALRSATGDRRCIANAGAVYLLADEAQPFVRVSGRGTAIAVRFPPEWLRKHAAKGGGDALDLATTPFESDETVLSLTQAMCSEVSRNAPSGSLFAESISLALLSCVTRASSRRAGMPRGNLSDDQRQALRSYIAEQLGSELSLAELASVVGLGPRHFSTLFRRAFAVTPHQFVMQQRLAEGARLLQMPHADIAAIAARLGFCSQSHFTAAFRSANGVTPRRFMVASRARATVLDSHV